MVIYWKQRPKPQYNLQHLLPGFETKKDTNEELEIRIKCLRNGKKSSRKLAKKLSRCKNDSPCMSSACSRCLRGYRRWFSGQVLKIIEQLDKKGRIDPEQLKFVTLVPLNVEQNLYDLLRHCPPEVFIKRMKDRLRQQLIRAGLGHLIIAGGIEADFDVETGKWEFHFHLIVIGLDKESREWKLFKHNNGYDLHSLWGDHPIRVDSVNDRPRQVSYCLKSYFSRKESYRNKTTDKKHKPKKRLKPTQQRIALRFLDKLKLEDRVFFFNLRRAGCELKLSSVSDKLAENNNKTAK